MIELLQVFYDPGKVFDKVREKRIWVAALVAVILVTVAARVYNTGAIGYENILRHQMDNFFLTKNMPADQKEAAVQRSLSGNKIVPYVSVAVVIAIITCVFALIYMGIAAMSGGPIKFTQALGTAVYTGWPFALLKAIMSALIVTVSPDKENLDIDNVVAMNIGAFLDKATTAKPLHALASQIDILLFAQLAFVAFGLSRVAKVPFAKTITWMVVIWVVLTLISVGFSFLG